MKVGKWCNGSGQAVPPLAGDQACQLGACSCVDVDVLTCRFQDDEELSASDPTDREGNEAVNTAATPAAGTTRRSH